MMLLQMMDVIGIYTILIYALFRKKEEDGLTTLKACLSELGAS
jgi:hypothetical protein